MKNSPAVVVLAPTRDLVVQIYKEFDRVLGCMPGEISVETLAGSATIKSMTARPKRGNVDVLVSTPGILSSLVRRGIFSMKNCSALVLDESDTLLDDSFKEETLDLMKDLTFRADGFDGTQLVLVSATIPRGLGEILDGIVDSEDLEVITSPFSHKPLLNIRQDFYRIATSKRVDHLFKLVKAEIAKDRKILVFCNKSGTTYYLQKFFEENGMEFPRVCAEIERERREGIWERFRFGLSNVLIATDVVSRGMESGFVDHVVNYDFPNFISDYIHRSGRVGRISSNPHNQKGTEFYGTVTNYISTPNQARIVTKIETSIRRNSPLENVNANITRKIDSLLQSSAPILIDNDIANQNG